MGLCFQSNTPGWQGGMGLAAQGSVWGVRSMQPWLVYPDDRKHRKLDWKEQWQPAMVPLLPPDKPCIWKDSIAFKLVPQERTKCSNCEPKEMVHIQPLIERGDQTAHLLSGHLRKCWLTLTTIMSDFYAQFPVEWLELPWQTVCYCTHNENETEIKVCLVNIPSNPGAQCQTLSYEEI